MKNLVLCLAALCLAAFPLAAQEEYLAPLPSVDGERAAIALAGADEGGEARLVGSDNFPSPRANEKAELRREAVHQQLASGTKAGKTPQVARGQYVDFPVERPDRIFVMLVEFGTQGGWITSPSVPVLSQTAGPLHNQIAQPNRATNNTTIWQPDYNREHYVDMYFNQMVDYYKAQSSGRYTFNGDVMHWVKVPFNGSRYGNNTLDV